MCIVRLFSGLNLLLVYILVKHEISAYFVQYVPHQETWFDAQTVCKVRGGRLATNEDELNCNQMKSYFHSSRGSTYWTGKYKTISQWISKIGCLEILGKPNVAHAYSVSKCFEECRKQHIKIKLLAHIQNKCVCISEDTQSYQKIVGIENCRQSLHSDSYYWAYTVTKNTTLNGSGNCAFVDCRYQPEVYTDNCATEYTSFCDNSFRSNWNISQEKCKYTTPGDLLDICIMLPIEHQNVWLPMHREEFWTTITCASSYNRTTYRNKTMENSAPRYKGTFSYKSTHSHDSNKRTIGMGDFTGNSSFSTIINSSSRLQSTISIIVKQKDNDNFTEYSENHVSFNNGLIVGGVLGALAIIGVIVLVIILKLRNTKAAAKSIYITPDEISSGTSHMYTDIQRKNPSNNETVNRIYENEVFHAGRPIPVGTTDTKIGNEKEKKNPNYFNTAIMTNNMTST
ncbi:uncharacterized protein LOC143055378 isoform X2 [Mytilus galloprovincialis]|uniref:uncharacterized protein LOC143055378 isoform X2 n=1 Tax=Mytilus galloprovincialis TaxID=29158 RepID=UPI003F7C686A